MRTNRWIPFLLALLAAHFCGAQPATNSIARLKPIPPFPALQAAAEARGIPLQGIDRPTGTNALFPGDSVTMLVNLYENGNRHTQWLILFQVPSDVKGPSLKPHEPMVLYTSTGNKFEFADVPTTIRVRTIGPFAEPNSNESQTSFKDKSATIRANKAFLGLGLNRTIAVMHQLSHLGNQQKDKTPFEFGISSEAYTSAQIAKGRAAAARLQYTREEERSFAGGIPALFSYFNTVQQTPQLKSILLKVLRMPSVWSIVKNLGITAGIQVGHLDDRSGSLSLPGWQLPPHSLSALPLEVTLNKHHALTLTMIVTEPQRPFLVCAGIVGFLAENPDDRKNYLTLRIVSAHCGNGASKDWHAYPASARIAK